MSNWFGFDDVVEIDGEPWNIVSVFRGREVKLHKQGTVDDYLVISLPEFYRLVGPAESAAPDLMRPEDDMWPPDVTRMAAHILETWEGVPRIPDKPLRAIYATSRPVEDRVQEKVSELADTDMQVSRATLYRYRTALKQRGHAGLNAAMHQKDAPKMKMAHVDERIIDAFDDVIGELKDESSKRAGTVVRTVQRRLRKNYPDEPELASFSHSTGLRYFKERDRGKYTAGYATTRHTAGNQPKRQYRSGTRFRPGERVEVDSTPLDVLVRSEDGQSYRPTLTLMLDVATGAPVAWALRPGSMTAADHALLLARAILPRMSHPGREETRLAASAVLPWETMTAINTHLTDDSLAMPWIFPEEITVDGGLDFRGSTFVSACQVYGISINMAPPRTPTAKPHVERSFKTIADGFATWLKGSTGNNTSNRGKKVQGLWSLEGLDMMLELYFATVYMHTPNKSRRDPFFPDLQWTPAQKYAALFEVAGGVFIPFEEKDYIKLLPSDRRRITRAGIQWGNRFYDSEAISHLRERTSSDPDGKWEIRRDPYNLLVVYVRDPRTGEYLQARDKSLAMWTAPMVRQLAYDRADGKVPNGPDLESGKGTFMDVAETEENMLRKEAIRQDQRSNLPRPQVVIPAEPPVRDVAPISSAETELKPRGLLSRRNA